MTRAALNLAAHRAELHRHAPHLRGLLRQLERLERGRPLTTKGLTMFNRHPVILDQLRAILPPPKFGCDHRPDTLLSRDLALDRAGREQLASAIVEAWQIEIAAADVQAWRTLNDVGDTIAAQLECAVA